MILLGLTGSIGMGKSTTAGLFAEMGVPVYDADAAVHRAYAAGGPAVAPLEAAFPGVTHAGGIDREKLSARVTGDPAALARLESIVHPLAAQARTAFVEQARGAGASVAVLDIPLLFETGGDALVDAVVVVSAPAEVQRQRALARPGMTTAKLAAILARQIPDAEKRAKADFIVDTGSGLAVARDAVRHILRVVTAPGWTGRRRRDG
ncbi:MAG TPA: dephospho-CoA kinase [Caulobacteraceae bacterium]|nr:dephospho-CoA kinase [Caulobacteraceae bacterium]